MTVLEHIKKLSQELSDKELRELSNFLEKDKKTVPTVEKPRSLRGSWKSAFPEDFDIDGELYKIRHEWEAEIEEILQ